MLTTLELPEKLLDEAMEVAEQKNQTAMITAALEQFIRLKKLSRIRELRGSMPDLDINLDVLRGRTIDE